jgi:hypothetical protein
MKRFARGCALFLCGVAVLPGLMGGCKSPRIPESHRTEAVIITNRAPEEINAATRAAFQHHQFKPVKADGDELVFQKRGSFMNSVWTADWFDGPAWVRVKVFQRPLDPQRTLLDCDVYVVQQPEDPFFLEEHKLAGKKKEYQSLLQEIAWNLNRERATQRP